MKRFVYLLLTALILSLFVFILSGCGECSHELGEPVTENIANATCSAEGSYDEVYYCNLCGAEITRTEKSIDKLVHQSAKLDGVEPSCDTAGLTDGEACSVCGEVITAQTEVPALGHSEVTDEGKEPTCTETGLSDGKHCTVCDEVTLTKNEIPALGHNEVTDEGKEPTCTETGLSDGKHCTVCDEVTLAKNELPALGHNEVTDEGKEPTCTETGLSDGKHCTVCGEVTLAKSEIPALGHNEVTDEGKEPTCTETGLSDGKHCTVCDEVTLAKSEIPALGHTHKDEDGLCDVCSSDCTFSITYMNGDEVLEVGRNYYIEGIAYELPTPGAEHQTFLGWYTSPTFEEETRIETVPAGSSGDLVLYARIRLETVYTITYYLDGGTNSEANITTYTANDQNFRFENPTKEGYEFHGWYTDPSFKNHIATLKGRTGDLVLYAKWVQVSEGGILTPEQPLN